MQARVVLTNGSCKEWLLQRFAAANNGFCKERLLQINAGLDRYQYPEVEPRLRIVLRKRSRREYCV
jgi:hypothetical protein